MSRGKTLGKDLLHLMSVKVSLEDYSWIVKYSSVSGIPISEVIRKAIKLYRLAMEKKLEEMERKLEKEKKKKEEEKENQKEEKEENIEQK